VDIIIAVISGALMVPLVGRYSVLDTSVVAIEVMQLVANLVNQ
jgi:hypothetical protein